MVERGRESDDPAPRGVPSPHTQVIEGSHGLLLMADRRPAPNAQPIVLLHGGGQTRHAWGETGDALAALGYDVTSLDLRGHGESGWSSRGEYRLDDFRDDLRAVLALTDRPSVVIGASLGGIASMLVAGEGPRDKVRALVLVDITHRLAKEGAGHIHAFMTANQDGFGSLEEAADAVSGYLPHRTRPPDPSGLMKNLRDRDGRLFWHWDPAFLSGMARDRVDSDGRLERAVTAITAPTLLVRGGRSDVVRPEDALEFQRVVPHAQFAEVDGAAHMVAGDENTVFGRALQGFLLREAPP